MSLIKYIIATSILLTLACNKAPAPPMPRNNGVPVGVTAGKVDRVGEAGALLKECDQDASAAPASISLAVTAVIGADGRQPFTVTIEGNAYEGTLTCAIEQIGG